MNLFKRIKSRKRSITRTYSHIAPSTPTSPTSPMSNVFDNDEEDVIDYSPIIQQEKDGKISKCI
jgi:hypothetical protein